MIILIGGMPTTGKTTLARELSRRLALPWLSTDQTRLVMQGVADPKQYPHLLSAHGLSAAEFFQRFSPEEIAEREYMHGIETWPGNKKLIEDDFTWREGFILEGVNILPSLLPSLQTSSDVRPLFLTDEGDDALRKAIFSRGLYADADTYADELKDVRLRGRDCLTSEFRLRRSSMATRLFAYKKTMKLTCQTCCQLWAYQSKLSHVCI